MAGAVLLVFYRPILQALMVVVDTAIMLVVMVALWLGGPSPAAPPDLPPVAASLEDLPPAAPVEPRPARRYEFVGPPKPDPEPLPADVWADPPAPKLPADVWAPKRAAKTEKPRAKPKPPIVCDFEVDPDADRPKPKAEPPKPEPPRQWWTDSTRPGVEIYGRLNDAGQVVVERWRWAGRTEEYVGQGPIVQPAPVPVPVQSGYQQLPVRWYFQPQGRQ